MKSILLIISCSIILCGCSLHSPNEVTAAYGYEKESEKTETVLPAKLEIDDGAISLSKIVLRETRTEHGYDGWIAFEFDLSALNKDEQYWFEKDYNISFYDKSNHDTKHNTIELNEFSEMQSELQQNGKKYIFWLIDEMKNPLEDANICIDINVWRDAPHENQFEIKGKCSDFEIVEQFPDEINGVFDELISSMHN